MLCCFEDTLKIPDPAPCLGCLPLPLLTVQVAKKAWEELVAYVRCIHDRGVPPYPAANCAGCRRAWEEVVSGGYLKDVQCGDNGPEEEMSKTPVRYGAEGWARYQGHW